MQSRLHNATKLKKIIQEANESIAESDVRGRMQPLKDLVAKTIDYLHGLFNTQLFLIICRGFWDCMGQVSFSWFISIILIIIRI